MDGLMDKDVAYSSRISRS